MEIGILCLLKEPACHLLASDFAELVFVLQTFIFGRGIAEHQPFQEWDGNSWTPLHFIAEVWILFTSGFLTSQAESSTYYSQQWVSTTAAPPAMPGWDQACTKICSSLLLSYGYPLQETWDHGPKGAATFSRLVLNQDTEETRPKVCFGSKETFPRNWCFFYITCK